MALHRFEFGLVHAIALSSYQPYCGGSLPCAVYQPGIQVGPSGNSPQYDWLATDLQSVRPDLTARQCECWL